MVLRFLGQNPDSSQFAGHTRKCRPRDFNPFQGRLLVEIVRQCVNQMLRKTASRR